MLRVVLQRGDTVFAAYARLLVSAHGHFSRRFAPRIDPADTRLKRMNHAMRTRQVLRDHARGETVFGGVGAINHFAFLIECEDAHDRAENLFANDAHVVAAIGEDGRLDVLPLRERVLHDAAFRRRSAARLPACRFR